MSTDIKRFQNACENGDLETVTKLFDDVNGNVNMLIMRNLAVKSGHLNIFEFFHKNGVDINGFYDHNNPLRIAATFGWIDTESRTRQRVLDDAKFNHARVIKFSVDYLLLQPEIDINIQDADGRTPLMIAVFYGKTDVVDRLLQNKQCDISTTNNNGNTAIFFASQNGYLEIVDKLILNGSDIWHIGKYGQTLLHVVVKDNGQEMVKHILSFGLDINHQNNFGLTPLMIAVMYDKTKNVEILLKYGADTTIIDNDEKTALDYARNKYIKDLLRK